jgi:hypothetical protein
LKAIYQSTDWRFEYQSKAHEYSGHRFAENLTLLLPVDAKFASLNDEL